MRLTMLGVLGFGLLVLGFCGPVTACPHVPPDYKFVVKETTKEALIYHDGVNAHLIIRTGFASEGELPDSMAWVIPLPSLPVSYKVEDNDLFRELYRLPYPPESKSMAPPPAGMVVHRTVMVGNYEISPIEILSADAGSELNDWLMAQGYNPVAAELQKFYLHPGASFLAVRLKGLPGKNVDLQPLHIVYKNDRAVFPLKFSSGSGQFDVMLYTLTPATLAQDRFWPYGFRGNLSLALNDIKAHKGLKAFYKAVGKDKGYITCFKASDLNDSARTLQYLPNDPGLESSEALPKE